MEKASPRTRRHSAPPPSKPPTPWKNSPRAHQVSGGLRQARKAALEEVRREWTWTRRWTLPALALALVLAAPSFVFAGALVQSEFGVLEPYDDTGGWKEEVWKLYGEPVQDCMLDSRRTRQVIECSFDVVTR